MVKTLLLALALAGGLAHARADDARPAGNLVIIGGHLHPDNAVVWERIVALAGGPGARIAVFPSAAAEPERSGAATAATLARFGAAAFVVPVAVRSGGVDAARRAADDEALAHQVAGAGGVFFVGGDQGRITAALRHADGTNTRILDAVWALYRRGGVVAGTSAGAAIMSSTMFYDAQEVLPTLQEGVHDGKDIAPGLGFIGTDVFIDQHLIVRGRFARMLPVMLARGYKLGLGVDENTAMVVDPGHTVHVLGATGAIVLDLAHARTRPGSFNIEDARIGYLDSGDACNLVTGAFLPAADKAPIDAAHPYYHGAQFAADILGPGSVLALMEKLVDSDQRSATGLAFGAPHSRHAALGFEFTLTRSAGTRAWLSNLTERYTVADLRLDVRPVRMHRPLYGQLPVR